MLKEMYCNSNGNMIGRLLEGHIWLYLEETPPLSSNRVTEGKREGKRKFGNSFNQMGA